MDTSEHATGCQEESVTDAQMTEFWSQVKTGRINKRNFQTFLRNGVKHVGQDLARDILGKDFISPDEVQKARNVSYTSEQLEELEETIPTKEELKKLRGNNMTLMPAPPKGMSLLEIRELNPALFYSETGSWYSRDEEKEAFSATDKTSFGWLAIRKDELPGSTNNSWAKQKAMVPEEMMIPNAAEVAWAITTYKAVRSTSLFSRVWVRTSSTDSDGRHVYLHSSSVRLNVGNNWDDHRLSDLGLAVAWKL